MTGNTVESTLDSRKATHGNFTYNAQVSQDLKRVLHHTCNWEFSKLSSYQKEAIDLIAHKIARILCGNPNEPDHWLDIAGYATLVYKRLTKETE